MDAEVKRLEGAVTQQTTAQGSKSERAAVVLKATDGKTYVLRRHGGNAFVDPDSLRWWAARSRPAAWSPISCS